MKIQAEAQAVIFDLDGTLLNTIADIAQAIEPVLESRGYEGHPVEDYKDFVGHGLRNSLINALPADHGLSEKEIDLLYAQMMRNYGVNPYENTIAYPGIERLLKLLQEMAIPVAILSNKDHELTKRIVANRLGAFSFKKVQGLCDDFPGKPDPGSARFISGLIGIPCERVLFIGDSEVDYQVAVNAQMIPSIVSWGFRSSQELRKTVPYSLICETPGQLIETVKMKLGLD